MVTIDITGDVRPNLNPPFFAPFKVNPIANAVLRLLSTHRLNERRIERLKDHRYHFPQIVKLTPVCPKTCRPLSGPIHTIGKQISTEELDFFSNNPLTNSYFLFQTNNDVKVSNALLL